MKVLIWIKEFFSSKHIQLALVSGTSIIALAFVSKRMLDEPMDKLVISLPAFMVAMAEGFLGSKKKAWYTNLNYWMIAVALTTILIIVFNLGRQ
jgi:hypothetical protein